MTASFLSPQRPLDRFPAVRTRSVEQLQQFYDANYATPKLELEDDGSLFSAKLNSCKLTEIALNYASYNAALRMVLPNPNSFMQFFFVHGNGEVVVGNTVAPIQPSAVKVTMPTERPVGQIGANHEVIYSRKTGVVCIP